MGRDSARPSISHGSCRVINYIRFVLQAKQTLSVNRLFACYGRKTPPYPSPNQRSHISHPQSNWPARVIAAVAVAGAIILCAGVRARAQTTNTGDEVITEPSSTNTAAQTATEERV